MADEDKDKEQEEEGKSGTPVMKIVIIAVLLSTILSGAVVGVTMFLLGGDEKSADEITEGEEEVEEEVIPLEPALYQSMDPKFVVSFKDPRQARFMQFSIDVMTRDQAVIDAITLHMPAIRSSMLLLAGNQEHTNVITREGKEQLLTDLKDDINTTLERLSAPMGVEAAFFTSFVIQ